MDVDSERDFTGRFTVTGLPGRKHVVAATIIPPGTRGVSEAIRDYVPDGEELVIRIATRIR